MQKKRIVHVIDDLGRGGAETLLVDLLKSMHEEYEIILVTLRSRLEFDRSEILCKEFIALHYNGWKDVIPASIHLRKLIKQYKPDLVRCQLYYSTIVTRLACPKTIPLFFSVHATMDDDPVAAHKRYFLLMLEKLTYHRYQYMIGVTQAVIDSFKRIHPKCGTTFLLHNFVRDEFFQNTTMPFYQKGDTLKLVTVSNLRLIKNIPYLVEVMNLLKNENILLDVYGDGPMKEEIQQKIDDYGLINMKLMGKEKNISKILPSYHVFVSCSTVEGFGIAVAEAMSMGLPVIVSSIPVYREVCEDKAVYIDNKSPADLAEKIKNILNGRIDIKGQSVVNRDYAKEKFSRQGYLQKLKFIYQIAFHQ